MSVLKKRGEQPSPEKSICQEANHDAATHIRAGANFGKDLSKPLCFDFVSKD